MLAVKIRNLVGKYIIFFTFLSTIPPGSRIPKKSHFLLLPSLQFSMLLSPPYVGVF